MVKFSHRENSFSAIGISLIVFFLLDFQNKAVLAQAGCGPLVPTFTVNLTGSPNGSWISPVIVRDDNCCGTSNPDVCVQFIITLDPTAQGILFNIYSGAVPPGAMFYQVNCGPQIAVGSALCLTGPGPYYLTFCKPGNNPNEYIINSISSPIAYGDSVTKSCNNGMISVFGFSEPTINWTSIFPGPPGTYNSYLSCTSGCDTTFVTPAAGAPAYIDYKVCGKIITLCDTTTVCDTARVYVFSPVQLSAPGNVCAGAASTSVTATPVGGASPYSYLWSNGQTTQTATGLGAGSYTVTLTDANGCTSSATINIYAVGNPTTVPTTSDISCYGGNNGSISMSTSGGTAGYSYQWSTGQTTSVITGLPLGNYSVVVTDANGCSDTAYAVVAQPTVLTSSVTATNVSCFGGNNGSSAVSAGGGTPAYSYSWNSGQTTSSVAGLAAGNYSVTTTDSKGCTTTVTVLITQPAAALSTVPSQANVSCFGGSNGAASVSVSGGTVPYGYSWSNGQTTSSVTGLTAGNYSVAVTDGNGCMASSAFVIAQLAALSSTASQTNTCSGAGSGTAQVSVTGGTSPYSYFWSNGQTTSAVAGLPAGTYSVSVTDANGCSMLSTTTISLFPALSSSSSQTNVLCSGANNGTASVTATGGNPAYSYSWNSGQTTSAATGLAPGNYSVTVTDASGCTTSIFFTISQPASPLSATSSQVNVSCNGGNNGSATVNVAGGTPAYTYLWNNAQTSSAAVGLGAGNYSVLITDANGCTLTSAFVITQPTTGLTAAITYTNVSCFGGNNGSAVISPAGGTPPYTFAWSNGQTTSSVTGLVAGNYTATVTDANGCATGTFTITQPPAPLASSSSQLNVLCNGGSNGSITSGISGGTPGYSYSWSNGGTTAAITGLSAGNYSLTVTDANGCTLTTSMAITEPAVLSNATNSVMDTCGLAQGSITSSPSGGTIPYSFLWSNGASTQTISGLAAGNYSVTVTDSNGCKTSSSVTILQFSTLMFVSVTPPDTVCKGQTIFISASVNGGTAPYTYIWNQSWTGPGPHAVVQTVPLTYSVTVTDVYGCKSQTQATTMDVYPSPTVSGNNVTVCNGQSATLTANASGGTGGPYSYSWSNSFSGQTQIVNVPISQSPAIFVVYANDGCITDTDTVVVTVNPPPIVSLNFAGDSGCIPLVVTFTATGDSGVTYLWNFGDTTLGSGNPAVHSYTASGSYTASLVATGSNGCVTVATAPAQIIAYPNPTAFFTTIPGVTPMSNDNPPINFSNQSSGAVSYYWNFGDGATSTSTDPQHYFPVVGFYTVTLITTNQYGCKDTFQIQTTGDGDIIFPNAFTPNPNGGNGGGYNPFSLDNDVFFPFAGGVKDFRMKIFNRWGELIFETTDIKIGWDGYYRNKLCQQDVYVWKAAVEFIDGKKVVKAGDVTLLR